MYREAREVGITLWCILMQVWDLRKVTKAAVFNPFEGKTTCVSWDHSGKYLACGGSAIKIYEVINKGKKKGAEAHVIKSLHDVPSSGVNSLAWGSLAHSLYVAAGDHNLRIYNC
jgi:pre-mRNA-processing factor 19